MGLFDLLTFNLDKNSQSQKQNSIFLLGSYNVAYKVVWQCLQ